MAYPAITNAQITLPFTVEDNPATKTVFKDRKSHYFFSLRKK